MRQRGGFSRKIGPNGINVDFDGKTFQLGVTGRLPEVVTYASVLDAVHEIVDELLQDAKPHFDRVQEREAESAPPAGPQFTYMA